MRPRDLARAGCRITPEGVAAVQRPRAREPGLRSYALPRRRVGCPSVPRPVSNQQSRLGRIEARTPLQVALSTSQGGPRPDAHAAERTEAFQLWRNPSSRPVRERNLDDQPWADSASGRCASPSGRPLPEAAFSAFVLSRGYLWRFTRGVGSSSRTALGLVPTTSSAISASRWSGSRPRASQTAWPASLRASRVGG